MYCRKCGTPNPDDRSNCIQCNSPLTSPLAQKPGSGGMGTGSMSPSGPTSVLPTPPAQSSGPTVIIPNAHSTGPQSPPDRPTTNPIPPIYQSGPSYQPTYVQQQSQQPMNYGAPPVMQSSMNTLAIVSAVCGGFGLFSCLCGILTLPSIAGIVTGFIAYKKVQETGEKGKELAIAGMITGGLGILLWIGWIIFVVILKVGGSGGHF